VKRLIPLTFLAGCAAPPLASPDPEAAAVALLSKRVFDPPDVLRPWFVEGVAPEDLPLRLVVDSPADYAFLDVQRLRMVDGRAVVTALVGLDGEPHTLDVWFEYRNGAWKVAGWTNVPHPADPSKPAPPAGADVPVPLASATFRGEETPQALALDAPPEAPDEPETSVRVGVQRPQVTGACDAGALQRHLKRLEPALRRCFTEARAERGGRLAFALDLDAQGSATGARVEETTLLVAGLSDCVEGVVRAEAAWPRPAEGVCAARVAVTFTPGR
jgi:hypothetical protein